MNKVHLNVTVDAEVLDELKKNRVNLSETMETAMLRKIIELKEIDNADYPKELAELEPLEYWVNPDGICKKRPKGQYFVNDQQKTFEVNKEFYLKWYNYYRQKCKSVLGENELLLMESLEPERSKEYNK